MLSPREFVFRVSFCWAALCAIGGVAIKHKPPTFMDILITIAISAIVAMSVPGNRGGWR